MRAHVTDIQSDVPSRRVSAGKALRGLLWDVLTAGITVLLLTVFVFQIYGVSGPSMLNTLHNGERMFVTKYQYLFQAPQRFDVVVCHFPGRGSEDFVKRVIGVPGDVISIENGKLYVNGEAHEEPYAQYPSFYRMEPVTVGPDEYYVMGDNRMISNDSRNPEVGPLSRKDIQGKVRAIIWPLSEIRGIQ